MNVSRRMSFIRILIFAASSTVAFSGFCDDGVGFELECPGQSIVTGIQTSDRVSGTKPVCSDVADGETEERSASSYSFRSFADFHENPKFSCIGVGHAMTSINACFKNDEVATRSKCRALIYVVPSSAVYTVVGEPNSPVVCEEGSVLHSFKYDRDNSGNLIVLVNCTALDIGKDGRTTYQEKRYCDDSDLVNITCPEGYLVTGVESTTRFLSPDATPVCSKIADKIIPDFRMTKTQFYDGFYSFVQTDCGDGSEPILKSFSLCFVDGIVTRSVSECRRFQDDVRVAAQYDIEARPYSKSVKCPEGSFFHGFRMRGSWSNGNESNVQVLAKCTIIAQ